MVKNWKDLMRQAYEFATQSRDPSTQNAALIVDDMDNIYAVGVNNFPEGVVETLERWQRPLKYKYIEHAERNACYEAASGGNAIMGLTMVCPWAPCTDCARAIIQCGIKRLVTHKQAYDRSPDSWKPDVDLGLAMLKEAGVEVVWYDGVVGIEGLRHSGQVWNP